MSKIALEGNASGTGTFTIAAPNSNSNYTLTLPTATGTVIVSGGAQTVEFAAGSVSAPSITFTGDTNTGIYSPGADTIAFTEGGVESMRIDSSGNVGIGTSSPVAKLHVIGDQIRHSNSGNASYYGTFAHDAASTGANIYNSQDTGGHLFQNSGSTVLTLNNSGNLGLGVTPSAWYTLGGYKVMQIGPGMAFDSGNDFRARITSNGYVNSAGDWKYLNTGYASNYNQSSGQHQWYTAPSGTAGNAITFTQAMTLDDSGRLALGTTSPDLKLTVDTSSGAGNTVNRHISMGRGTTVRAFLGTNKDTATDNVTALVFGVDTTERARIDSSGRFFVGTTAVTTSSGQSGEIYSTGSTGFLFTNNTAGNYALGVKNEGASGTRNLINFLEGTGGGTARANISLDGSNNFVVTASNATLFTNGGSERARIDNSGNLLVGTTSIIGSNGCVLEKTASGGRLYVRRSNADNVAEWYYDGTRVGSVSINSTNTSYNTGSDYRLKENVQPMTGALAKVAALKPCTFKWKVDGSDGEGFIAHELAEVCPQAVSGEKDAVDADGNPKYQGIDTSFLVATLTAAIQEQQALIQSLTAATQELKAELDATKAQVAALQAKE